MKKDRGFTLMEIVLVCAVSSVLLLAVSDFAITGISDTNQDYNKTLVLSNAKEAVGIVAAQVRAARSVESANSLADNYAPSAPSNLYSWSGAAGNGKTLILAVPARDSSGNLIYVDSLHNTPYTNDVIFYLDSTTHKLYKRTIKNTSATGNAAITTCPPAHATPSCPSDSDVVDDVANLVTNYLDSTNSSVTLPSGTEAVQYTVTETRTINGHAYSGTYSTVASLRNK